MPREPAPRANSRASRITTAPVTHHTTSASAAGSFGGRLSSYGTFYVVPRNLTSTLQQLYQTLIAKHGGVVASSAPSRRDDADVAGNLVVVTSLMDFQLILRELGWKFTDTRINSARFVAWEWVAHIISSGAPPRNGTHEIPPSVPIAASSLRTAKKPPLQASSLTPPPPSSSPLRSDASGDPLHPDAGASSEEDPDAVRVADALVALAQHSAGTQTPSAAAAIQRFLSNMRVGGAGANLNSHITSVLEVLYERHSLAGEVANAHFRAYQYRRAIISLRRHPVKITTLQQLEALELPGIRDKIKTKVGQIIQTGTCDAIEHGKPVWEDAVKRFMSVHGVGPAVAKQFYFKGYRTLDDLYVDRLSLLNEAQRMGLLYHEDLQHRIPRAEVSAVYASVKRVAQSIVKDMEVHCTGSYRRGAATCGDIDILLSHPSMTAERAPKFMELLNDQLTCHGLLIANLTRDTSSIKHMGIARLPHVGARARRLDLLWVPHKELGASLLYFTGSDMFNRSMRLLAGRCGYSLSQHGLAAGVAQLRGKKVNDGVVVAGVTEQEVFDRLGIPFIEPKDREVS